MDNAGVNEHVEYVQMLCKRILSFLPNRTGHSVDEIEMNTQFITTKKLLLETQANFPEVVSYIIYCCLNQLSNIAESDTKLKNRDERLVTTTYMLTKLLAEMLKENWHRQTAVFTLIVDFEIVLNYLRFSYYDKPSPIEPPLLVAEILDTFVQLMSLRPVRQVFGLLKEDSLSLLLSLAPNVPLTPLLITLAPTTPSVPKPLPLANIGSMGFGSSENTREVYPLAIGTAAGVGGFPDLLLPLSRNQSAQLALPNVMFSEVLRIDNYITEIDNNLELILRYIALANPGEYYQYLHQRLLMDKGSDTMITEDVLKIYCPLVKFVFFSKGNLRQAGVDNFSAVNRIKSTRWKLTYLTFTAINVRNQTFCRPQDFADIVTMEIEEVCRDIFDYAYSLNDLRDLSVLKRLMYFIQTWFLILCPSEFSEFILSKPKLRPNKRLKFLAALVRDAQARKLIEPFLAIVNIFHVGARLPPTHPIAQFTKKYLDQVYDLLTTFPHESTLDYRYENCLVLLYLAALMVLPQAYMKLIIQKFIDYKDNVKEVKILVKIIKGVLVLDGPAFMQLMKTLAIPLKLMIFRLELIFGPDAAQASKDQLKLLQTSLDQYLDMPLLALINSNKPLNNAEEMLAILFQVFTAAPELYFQDPNASELTSINESTISAMSLYAHDVTNPLKQAFTKLTTLFQAACDLALKSVELKATNEFVEVLNFLVTNLVVQLLCEAGLLLSINDPKFKALFVFINEFMAKREPLAQAIEKNRVAQDPQVNKVIHSGLCSALEQILLVSLCTHDIQFYNIAKSTMRWYIQECKRLCNCQLRPTFERIINENAVFTGFVLLHKKFKLILREAYPTELLYQVWLVIYQRWRELLENKLIINDENLVFRHFTGFLVLTLGCFISQEFDSRALVYILEFFDKCIGLLMLKDLVIRVVIKETLLAEAHIHTYHLIISKLIGLAEHYTQSKIFTEDSMLFIEQLLVIMLLMIGLRNEGLFLIISLLPEFLLVVFRYVENVTDPLERMRLKLRFCRLGCSVELAKRDFGILGLNHLRNRWAKRLADWLEDALFHTAEDGDDELIYMNADFATQCLKVLALQLEELVLEVPDGIKELEQRKYKDLAFGNFFSLFYKIIQKYTTDSPNRHKYKFHLIADNVLKCISNVLQLDTDIGMQFVLPLGYHLNTKIRALFLNVFSWMLTLRQIRMQREEFPEDTIYRLTGLAIVYGAVARVALLTEHNLLALALYGVFSYTRQLDMLFDVLLHDEIITNCQRLVDIFRRNSTITRLLLTFAKDAGLAYLQDVIAPFINELLVKDITFEVEKVVDVDEKAQQDALVFMQYFEQLVDRIASTKVPALIQFVCHAILKVVLEKFEDALLVAVGLFIFLRFLCPAIVSPELFVNISVTDTRTKRSLMQLVKVLQNVANDLLLLLKWPALAPHQASLFAIKEKVYQFLQQVLGPVSGYPFEAVSQKPLAELRYLHKFLYHNYLQIRSKFLLGDPYQEVLHLQKKINAWCQVDGVMLELRLPKPNVKLQITLAYRQVDQNAQLNAYNDFMAKMLLTYVEKALDLAIIRNLIFHDGTPVVVLLFRYMFLIGQDIQFMIYKLFECAAQVWDNQFYMVYDFTEYEFRVDDIRYYCLIFMEYAPVQMIHNCKRVYYFNIPVRFAHETAAATLNVRRDRNEFNTQLYAYSQVDKKEIINNLCLDTLTVLVLRDVRVLFSDCQLVISDTRVVPVLVRLGREWLQICLEERIEYSRANLTTPYFYPVEVYRLSKITKCEVSDGHENEFTIWLENSQLVLRLPERAEIMRFLYFSTLRLAKNHDYLIRDHELGEHFMPWFGRLYNIVFQGLLLKDTEVRLAALNLFALLLNYFNIDFGLKTTHSKSVALPSDITLFVVTVLEHLAQSQPKMTFRIFKAFFDNYDKLPNETRLLSIMVLRPWVDNVFRHVFVGYLDNGNERVAEIARQFCRMTVAHQDNAAFMNDYIWRPLFAQEPLLPVLIDEVVLFAIDNTLHGNWDFITGVISPLVEVCLEVVDKLLKCVTQAKQNDLMVALRLKLFEIRVLVNICALLFFNLYLMTRLFFADIFFLVTLFIDNVYLEFGADLQKLVINMIQLFFHKPKITPKEEKLVDDLIQYFSDQRAKMLFGVLRDIALTGQVLDASQVYNRALNFETLCDYLNNFLQEMGSTADKLVWRLRWVSNAIEVATLMDSLFQNRALMIVGILLKQGCSDAMALRFLRIISNDDLNGLDVTTNAVIATLRIIHGLPKHLILPPVLLWPQLCFGLLDYSELYQALTSILVELLSNLVIEEGYIDRAFELRKLLEPLYLEFAEAKNVIITKRNFHYHVLVVFTQGMRISHYKSTLLELLKLYLSKSILRTKKLDPYLEVDNDIDHLTFIALLSLLIEFAEFLNTVGLGHLELIDIGYPLPKVVIDFFLANHDPARICLLIATQLYCAETVDSLYKSRFLPLYRYLLANNKNLGFLVYPTMRKALECLFINTTSDATIEIIAEIKKNVLAYSIDAKRSQAEIDNLLERNQLRLLNREPCVPNPDLCRPALFQAEVGLVVKNLQTMVYRALCLVVDNQPITEE